MDEREVLIRGGRHARAVLSAGAGSALAFAWRRTCATAVPAVRGALAAARLGRALGVAVRHGKPVLPPV
jgi:hypothetical protein